MASDDIAGLMAATDVERLDTIYQVGFEVQFEDDEWVFDQYEVLAGEDGEEAWKKLKAFVFTAAYSLGEVKIKAVRLKGLKELAHAEIL